MDTYLDGDDIHTGFEDYESDFLTDSKEGGLLEGELRNPRIAIIRTSDRNTYRRCRRKWGWSYSGRGNLRQKNEPAPFWLGSGMHFALEDYHGYHKFEHPSDALRAYARATELTKLEQPPDKDELLELGCGMLTYYEVWLKNREPLNTLWLGGEPQVEVNIHINIPKEDLLNAGCSGRVLDLYDQVLYSLTIDRVVQDVYNRLWTIEYKSAKQYGWYHLETDPQISAYAWGMHLKYPEYEISGTCYQQHKKQLAKPPDFLSSTKAFSTSKRLKTTYAMYFNSLENLYGPNQDLWPTPNRLYLEYLFEKESQTEDFLIKRDFVERNEYQIEAEYQKILLEVSEMLDPDLKLYPNPTRDCRWDCSFNLACIHKDSGADWKGELEATTTDRSAEENQWRQHLIYP